MAIETAHVTYEDSAMGKLQGSLAAQNAALISELQKLRKELDDCRSEYAAYKDAEEERAKRDARKVSKKSIIGTLIVTIIGGLFIYYWPSIVSFVVSLFHR